LIGFRAVCFTAVLLCGFAAAPAAADVTVTVSYVEVHDRILPTASVTRTRVQLEAKLQQSGAIAQSEQRASGRASGASTKALKLGAGGRGVWRVVGANQLINIVQYPSYERAILVTIEGTSCSVKVGYTLKPGFSDYRYKRLTNSEPAVARSVTPQDVNCSISGN